jgi:hypothetical protein
MSNLIFTAQSSSPAAIGSGKSQIYAKTDGKIYKQVEDGAETEIVVIPTAPTQTVSTSDPDGGSDGDIWYKYYE